jgi:carboxyl-terminal processing protease
MIKQTVFAIFLIGAILDGCISTLNRMASGFLTGSIQKVSSSSPLSPKDRIEIFEEVWRTINENYYDPSFNGVDWRSAHDAYRPRIEAAKSDDEFYKLVNEMLGKLQDSHTHFDKPAGQPSGNQKPSGYDVGITVYGIGDQVAVVSVAPDTEAAKAGVKPGMLVQTVDGKSVKEQKAWLQKEIRPKVNLSTERTFEFLVYKIFFIDDLGTTATIRLIDHNGKPLEIKVKRQKIQPALAARRLPSGYGYIKFDAFLPPHDKWFRAELQKLMDTSGLIIDLRGNNGGRKEEILTIAANFFAPGTYLGEDVGRSVAPQGFPVQKVDKLYKGEIAILVDELSASAAEVFACFMQDLGRATIIGRQTSGAVLRAEYKKMKGGALSYSAFFYKSPKGRKIEKIGVIPDKTVSLTIGKLQQQRDEDIEQAEECLRSQSCRPAKTN